MLEFISGLFLSKITVLIIDAIAIYLASLVYRDNPKGKTNILYVVVTALMLMWVNAAYIPRLVGQQDVVLGLFLLKIAWFATPLFFTALYLLVIYSMEKQRQYRILTLFIFPLGFTLSFITGTTNLVVKNIIFKNTVMSIEYGDWKFPFLFAIFLIIIATLYPIFKGKAFRSKNIQHLLVGILIFYIANLIFNISFPMFFGIAELYFFGDYSTIILLSFIAYGIIKYKLFNIKVITTELLVFSVLILSLIDITLATKTFDIIFKIAVFIFIFVFSIFLVKSVRKEVEQKEQLEKLSERLEVANVELKKLDQSKTEFLSITSHQLRTPLSAIKGYLSMMIDGDFGTFKKEQQEVVEHTFSEVERLIRLVQVFLNVSRIESGRLNIDKIECDISDLVQGVVTELTPTAEDKKLKLTFKKPIKLTIQADKDKLKDVVVNLVDNAIKYTPHGSINVTVTKEADLCVVAVHDTGVGIDPVEADRLFKKFARAKGIAQVSSDGSGLGLFIAKKIVEAHGGEIWIDSEGKGKGSTFAFKIPIR